MEKCSAPTDAPKGKRKRTEESCSQDDTQGTSKVPQTRTPAKKKRKRAVNLLSRTTQGQRKDTKPDTFASCYIIGEKLGTLEYRPPEILLEGWYHAKPATVWSLGVLLFRLVWGYLPFTLDEEIIEGLLYFKDGLSNECCNLIRWCLQHKPTRRPNLEQIKLHDWFRIMWLSICGRMMKITEMVRQKLHDRNKHSKSTN
ncbi:hypothetical protein MHYP_G00152660 [Metynnis hypsauchen]